MLKSHRQLNLPVNLDMMPKIYGPAAWRLHPCRYFLADIYHENVSAAEVVAPQTPAFRRQVGEGLQAVIKQLPPPTLDEHVTGKFGDFQSGWEPPCRLVTHRMRKLAFKLLSYKVSVGSALLSVFACPNESFIWARR